MHGARVHQGVLQRSAVTDNLSKLDRYWLVTTFARKIECNSKRSSDNAGARYAMHGD